MDKRVVGGRKMKADLGVGVHMCGGRRKNKKKERESGMILRRNFKSPSKRKTEGTRELIPEEKERGLDRGPSANGRDKRGEDFGGLKNREVLGALVQFLKGLGNRPSRVWQMEESSKKKKKKKHESKEDISCGAKGGGGVWSRSNVSDRCS